MRTLFPSSRLRLPVRDRVSLRLGHEGLASDGLHLRCSPWRSQGRSGHARVAVSAVLLAIGLALLAGPAAAGRLAARTAESELESLLVRLAELRTASAKVRLVPGPAIRELTEGLWVHDLRGEFCFDLAAGEPDRHRFRLVLSEAGGGPRGPITVVARDDRVFVHAPVPGAEDLALEVLARRTRSGAGTRAVRADRSRRDDPEADLARRIVSGLVASGTRIVGSPGRIMLHRPDRDETVTLAVDARGLPVRLSVFRDDEAVLGLEFEDLVPGACETSLPEVAAGYRPGGVAELFALAALALGRPELARLGTAFGRPPPGEGSGTDPSPGRVSPFAPTGSRPESPRGWLDAPGSRAP